MWLMWNPLLSSRVSYISLPNNTSSATRFLSLTTWLDLVGSKYMRKKLLKKTWMCDMVERFGKHKTRWLVAIRDEGKRHSGHSVIWGCKDSNTAVIYSHTAELLEEIHFRENKFKNDQVSSIKLIFFFFTQKEFLVKLFRNKATGGHMNLSLL